ncbi:Eukaryotic translation initiation factor 6 [Dictyocoela roeselum]|nr:Eukaryotic translation initiation factor 6 [Dictyocoela roeselum]
MTFKIDFEGSGEIGAYTRLTNKYVIIGKSDFRNFYSHFQEHIEIPIVETTINSIKTVGSQCQGTKNGLVVPSTITDQELLHLRNSLPEDIKICTINERLNALGNVVVCNDKVGLVHPEVAPESIEEISDCLKIELIREGIGSELLVGTFSVINNAGMMVHPNVSKENMERLESIFGVKVMVGTVNRGSSVIGGGLVVNDWIGYTGYRTTNTEISIIDTAFGFTDDNIEEKRKAWVESLVN